MQASTDTEVRQAAGIKSRAGLSDCFFFWLLSSCAALAQERINFADHVLPVVEANCGKCHNADKKKADLDLTSYQGALKGSGSGSILVSGNPDASKLWRCLTHAEEPAMPPNRPKLGDKELDLFKKWINGGLLESAGGKAIVVAKAGVDLTLKPDDLAKPSGPPPMPQDLPLEPVIHTAHGTAITGLAASPWAPLVAVAGQKQVLLFDVSTLHMLGALPFPEGEPVEVKFSSNGRLLLASGGWAAKSGRVVIWEITTGERLMTLGNEYDTVLTADIRPDQSLVALGGPSRLVKVYSTQTGELQQKIKKHTDWVTAIAFSPNGQMLATADRNGGLCLWDPENGQELFTLGGHKSAITALSWRPDSKLLASSSEDGTIKLWETKEGKEVKSWKAHAEGTLGVCYSRDGHLASCGRDRKVMLWDANGGKVREFEFFGNIPVRVGVSQDNTRMVAGDFLGRVAVWDASDGKRMGELNVNPPTLDEQLASARRHLAALQAALLNSKTNVAPQELTAARETVARLEGLQVLSFAYRTRESLGAKKRERDQLTASLTPAAGKKATLSKSANGSQPETSCQPRTSDAGPARRLAAEVGAEEARLERLLSYYRSFYGGR